MARVNKSTVAMNALASPLAFIVRLGWSSGYFSIVLGAFHVGSMYYAPDLELFFKAA